MNITSKWLTEKGACRSGKNWFIAQKETNGIKVIKTLIDIEKLDWANWLIVRIMKRKQYLAYAIFAAEQVLDIFEKKYPEDKRPRKAIETARKCLESDTTGTAADAAAADAAAAYAAAYAAHAAHAADAADAADAAAHAAHAAYAAYAA
ncbi:MAG: putative immunity protein, partial [Patescibacteria group bacterium]